MSNNLTLTLETVTPLFLGGAEARGTPELRPPAFRGALRYWLRAALGGVLGDDVEKVRKAEAAVFGSADEGGPGASAVTVRIAGQQRLSMESYSQIAGWDPERKSFSKPGTAYLFFAARRTQRESERNALLGTCSLNLSTRPGVAEPEDKFRKAYAAFWLLTHIGGIGARSRRGAGALQVTKIEGDASVIQGLPSPLVQAETPEHLILELKQGLETIRHYIDPETSHRQIQFQQPSAFDVIHPSTFRIWVMNKTYKDWNKALDEIGRVYQAFRGRRPPDYNIIKDAMTRNRPLSLPVQRAAFGLPIPYYYRSLGGETATLEAEEHDRRASPLWIRVVKLADATYAVVLTWFQAEFLPSGEGLSLRRGRTAVSGSTPDSSLVEAFVTQPDPIRHSSLKDKGLAVSEVRYA